MNCLRSLEHWDRGFESHSRHGFILFVLSFVSVAALRRANYSSKESYRLYTEDYGTEEEGGAKQMTVEPLINEWKELWIAYYL
jgi:hypothetical protein